MHRPYWATTLALACVCIQQGAFADNTTTKTEAVPPDNTRMNAADQKENKPTAQDQSNRASDVEITRKLRKAIMGKKGFSVNAQNVKIITDNGVLTLKGPVNSVGERETIEALAKDVCGSACNISNQLKVKQEKKAK